MISKLSALLFLMAGCDRFDADPGHFSLEVLSPLHIAPVDVFSHQNQANLNRQLEPEGLQANGQLVCSLSDPIIALSATMHGCPTWGAWLGPAIPPGAAQPHLTGMSTSHQVLTYKNPAGQSGALEVLSVCDPDFENAPIELTLTVQYSGFSSALIASRDEPILDLLPVTGGRFAAVGRTEVDILEQTSLGMWQSIQHWATDVPKKFYSLGDVVIGKSVCDGFACPENLASLFSLALGRDVKTFAGALSSTQLVGRLAPGRLAFYQLAASGPEIMLISDDLDAGSVKHVALSTAAFPVADNIVPGMTTAGGLTYVGFDGTQFWSVAITAGTESVSETSLGTYFGPAPVPSVRFANDGSTFAYWARDSAGTSCLLAVRDAAGNERWHNATCVTDVTPVFISDERRALIVVVDHHNMKMSAFDLSTGELAWSFGGPGLFGGAPVSLHAIDDAVIFTGWDQQRYDLRVIDANGLPRFTLERSPLVLSGGVIPVGDGSLLEFEGTIWGSIQTADAKLNAPPNLCTWVDCGSGQVNLATDTLNCGACAWKCDAGKTCESGSCQ